MACHEGKLIVGTVAFLPLPTSAFASVMGSHERGSSPRSTYTRANSAKQLTVRLLGSEKNINASAPEPEGGTRNNYDPTLIIGELIFIYLPRSERSTN